MLGRFLVVMMFVVIGACASTAVDYAPKEGSRPEGFSQEKLEENLYLVRFETYKKSTFDEVEQLALRRAAELTREKGFVEFEVVKKDRRMGSETEWVPETATFQGGYANFPQAAPFQSVPGYTRAFHIRTVELVIRLLNPAQ